MPEHEQPSEQVPPAMLPKPARQAPVPTPAHVHVPVVQVPGPGAGAPAGAEPLSSSLSWFSWWGAGPGRRD